ncbi:uncharacterized protein LOC130713417 [Lotus japonicus]|uniref:uncharacterized protein LOC130713417 n=1 Tax=Lotus japonicus TaxID=34305 RepID=UPI0025870FB0|nr:uncharacterized protein LOC130713417 [Lotus japonicus]
MCPFYTNIRGFVSNKCLQLLNAEHIRMKSYGRCDCLLRETHGLPCGCELAGYERIPYEAIHPFWKRLSWEHVPEPVADTISNHICGMNHGDMQPEVEALTHYFSSLDTGGRSMVRRKLQAIYCPESSSLCTPEVQIRSKRTLKANERKPPKVKAIGSLTRDPSGFEHIEREIKEAKKASQPPKKKKRVKKSDTSYFMGHFPSFFHPYIHTVQNVEDDGNCGYRAIAALLGLPSGEEALQLMESATPLGTITTNVERVESVVGVIKSCTPNGFGDAKVTLKDPTGTVDASIHRKAFTDSEFGNAITVGSVLVLQKVAVFAPSKYVRYLNITLPNVVEVFPQDNGPNDFIDITKD